MRMSFFVVLFSALMAPLFVGAQSYLDEEIPVFRHQVKIGFPVEIGLSTEIPSTGIHISYNPTYKLTDYFAAEAQLSYTYADFERNSSTFARDGGDAQSLNFLMGARLLLFREDQRFRLYANAMAGLLQYVSAEFDVNDEIREEMGLGVGISTGVFAFINNTWSVGVSLETRNFIVVRGGYTF